MKKNIFALVLAALLVLCAASALAATDVTIDTGLSLDVHFVSEQDIDVETMGTDGACVIFFGDVRSEDAHDLLTFATLATSEEVDFEGKTLSADTTDEQIEGLFKYAVGAIDDDSENPYTCTVKDLDDGVRAIVIIDENLRDEVGVLTIRDGLFIEVFAMYPDFHAVTDEDIEYAISLLDDFKFIESTDEVVLDGNGGVVEAK